MAIEVWILAVITNVNNGKTTLKSAMIVITSIFSYWVLVGVYMHISSTKTLPSIHLIKLEYVYSPPIDKVFHQNITLATRDMPGVCLFCWFSPIRNTILQLWSFHNIHHLAWVQCGIVMLQRVFVGIIRGTGMQRAGAIIVGFSQILISITGIPGMVFTGKLSGEVCQILSWQLII